MTAIPDNKSVDLLFSKPYILITYYLKGKAMAKEERLFRTIVDQLVKDNEDVQPGKMMSSPGITYKQKVFAFFHKNQMVFRLGKQFDPGSLQIDDYSLLNPFKNKPPLAGWFQISYDYHDKWPQLAGLALKALASEIDKE